MSDRLPPSEAVRAAIRDSGITPYAVAKAADLATTTVTRFLNGERDISLSVVDKLAPILGLEVTWKRLKPAKGRQARKQGGKQEGNR